MNQIKMILMKEYYLFIILSSIPLLNYSQVGIGTTTPDDNIILEVLSIERLRIDSGDQVYASSTGGTETLPFYSFSGDEDTGIWTNGANNLSIGSKAQEFLTLYCGLEGELVVNQDGDAINTHVETNENSNSLYIIGMNNRIGILIGSPATEIHVGGTSSVIRVDALNSINNGNNNGVDLSPLAASANVTSLFHLLHFLTILK